MPALRTILQIFTMVIAFHCSIAFAEPPEHIRPNKVNKTTIQEWKFFDVNTIQCTINSSGPYADYLRTNSSGLTWPKGTNKTAVFTAGIWIIGKHATSDSLRTAVQDFSTEFQPGPILTTYNTQLNSIDALGDPADPKYRIYKVHRRDSIGNVNPDYDNWPVDLGAPYEERNGIDGYQAGEDKPLLWGDQVLWSVYNDGNSSLHSSLGKTKPMGIEVQATYFGFDQPRPLGNIMFMRWKIINKSDADYDSVFISMWSDTDLGDATDDLTAVDTLRSLAYVYNADNNDGGANGYGNKPPADGFIFLQGPKVTGLSSDTALYEGRKIPGYKNLPATSHVMYTNKGVDWDEPPIANIAFAERAYNYQNGLIGMSGLPFVNPQTSQASKFVFPGDPVTNTGWTQTSHPIEPTDVRSMISSGPFTLAKGDTQEIVGSFVIAQGADRLNSIHLLRQFADVAKAKYLENFDLQEPKEFSVTVTPLNNKIILSWDTPDIYLPVENYFYIGPSQKYLFEGYNVYQIEEEASNSVSKRIATYDLINSITAVYDWLIDTNTGLVTLQQNAFGTDSGIKRSIEIDIDSIAGGSLVGGKEYYFSVVPYVYNHDSTGFQFQFPQIREFYKKIITVTPLKVSDITGNEIIPAEYYISQNYPNPFNPITTISYQLPKSEMVTLKVYNILGQEIKTLISEVKQSGYHSVQWHGDNTKGMRVTSGVYLYVISSPSYTMVKKMILLK